ncbi:hypothetical protein VWZ82_12820 [Phaeobacter sp. JH20_41]|uniref:hypothetical protein n=1 Tax=Phaeobacter sp. JH20_41 TaxID=3112498 RepID=UPI003A893BD2
MEAPERIWATPDRNGWLHGYCSDVLGDDEGAEYIRADTVTALQEEVERLRDICRMALPLIRAANLEEVTDTRDWHEIEGRIAAALAKEGT